MAAMDPWDMLSDGECQDRSFAFFTICITESEEMLATCLASICSLLVTTDPACVVAMVSRWVYSQVADALARSGVLAILAPEWAPLSPSHRYAHLEDRRYPWVKMEAFRMTQFERVAHFDPDVIFMRNASGLRDVEPFATSRVFKGMRPSEYRNMGVTVLRPSLQVYNELIFAWRAGDYELHFSHAKHGDTDVIMELCLHRGRCGPLRDLDACTYNHGVWLPRPYEGGECRVDQVVARHNFRFEREAVIGSKLQSAFLRGTCRPRAAAAAADVAASWGAGLRASNSTWSPEYLARLPRGQVCWSGSMTPRTCCRRTNRHEPWGNRGCWGSGFTYERCCLGIDDAPWLRADLQRVGDSWYGLSSMPDKPPRGFFGAQCRQVYEQHKSTFAAYTGGSVDAEEAWPTEAMLRHGVSCEALAAPNFKEVMAVYVLFEFRLEAYFERHGEDAAASRVWQQLRAHPEHLPHFRRHGGCVPSLCCTLKPTGIEPDTDALEDVLWSMMVEIALHLPLGLLPRPRATDFHNVLAIDANDPTRRHPCVRV